MLDYCQAQFTQEQLRAAHCAVVNAFRTNRTVSLLKLQAWDVSNNHHELTRYCIAEVQHHIAGALGANGDIMSKGLTVDGHDAWLLDIPADCVNTATVKVLGCERVFLMASDAAAASNHWRAACLYHVAGNGMAAEGDRGKSVRRHIASPNHITKSHRRPLLREILFAKSGSLRWTGTSSASSK